MKIALSSGLSRTRIAADWGIVKSTMENQTLLEEREILKKLPGSSRAKSHEVRFYPRTSA